MTAQLTCHVQQFDSDLEIRNGIKLKWTFHQFEILLRTCQCYGHQLRNVNPIEMHADDISMWYEFDKSHKGQEGMSKFIAWSLLHRTAEIVSYWMGVRQIIQEIQSLYDRDSILQSFNWFHFCCCLKQSCPEYKVIYTIIMLWQLLSFNRNFWQKTSTEWLILFFILNCNLMDLRHMHTFFFKYKILCVEYNHLQQQFPWVFC